MHVKKKKSMSEDAQRWSLCYFIADHSEKRKPPPLAKLGCSYLRESWLCSNRKKNACDEIFRNKSQYIKYIYTISDKKE